MSEQGTPNTRRTRVAIFCRTRVAIFLHWLMAALIFTLLALGAWMTELSYYHPRYHDALAAHRAVGMLSILVAVCMIAQKISATAMPPATGLKAWETIAAKSAHLLLFALMLLIPMTGYLISTSAGDGVSIFSLFSVPALFNISEKIRDAAVSGHYWLAYGGALLAFIHAAAALKHHFLDKNEILRRMWRH